MKHQYVDSAIQDIDSSYNAMNISLALFPIWNNLTVNHLMLVIIGHIFKKKFKLI